jgi:hypothetical protein
MRILKSYNDNQGNLKSIDVEIEIGESENYIISSFKKTNPNIIVNIIPTKIHINQYDNVYLYKGDYSVNKKTSSIGKTYPMTSVQSKESKKLLTSVQCVANNTTYKNWYIGDREDFRCGNKTRNPNGLCHIHQLIDKNVTIKYWKD